MTRPGAYRIFFFSACAGVAHAWSVALPWNGQSVWWLQLLGLGALVFFLEGAATVGRAAMIAATFGTGWLCGSFWWLFISMHVYGGLPSMLAAAAVLLLAAALSLYLALAAAAFRVWAPMGSSTRAALFACLWLLAELARGRWFTGLPWGASGYAHLDGPFSSLAPWVGVYGIGAIAAFIAASISIWLAGLRIGLKGDRSTRLVSARRHLAIPLAAALLVAFADWANPSFTQPAGSIDVALLQGNIPQDEKFQPGSGIPIALNWYAAQFRAVNQDLVIAPETAIPMLVQHLPAGYWSDLTGRFAAGEQAALIGMPVGGATQGYRNAVIGLKPGQSMHYQYDKHHLVPFGEFVPPMFRWFTQMMQIPLGDFLRGPLGQAPFEWKAQRIAPNVCYEDLFGEELAKRFADDAAAPTIFANLSNIAWFGNGIAIDQHLGISRMRAREFERPFVRATNTGATAIIDHRGVVTHVLPRATRGVLLGEVQGRTGVTPYVAWVGPLGLWPLWLLGAGAVLLAAVKHRTSLRAKGRTLKSAACVPPP